jgi:hypothetical protein
MPSRGGAVSKDYVLKLNRLVQINILENLSSIKYPMCIKS